MRRRKWWGWGVETTAPEAGYFFCPTCARRQPTRVYQTRRRFYVCLVSAYTTEATATYRCDECRREYPAEEGHGFDFSASPEPSQWACFKCGGIAPGHVFICPHCGFSLNRTVEALDPNRR
jgi:hypothetical protein